jgi:beta-carotene ketolase (CrtW type)
MMLGLSLQLELERLQVWWMLGLIAVQTFLHTGLFITAHDAMHGSVYPRNRGVNDAIGAVATTLYALFSYRTLHEKHWEHHREPGTDEDPDFHDHQSFWRWYGHFVWEYIGWAQILGMAAVYNIAHHLLGIPVWNLNVFWVLPACLSTLQLFYFGTFLPHRTPEGNEDFSDEHRSRSNDFHPVLSFLSCYHFGYHWEHHEHPGCPWWRLPEVRREQTIDGPPEGSAG